MSEPRHIRLPFMAPLVLAIASDCDIAIWGNDDGASKNQTRRLGPPRAKPGDIVDVCEGLVRGPETGGICYQPAATGDGTYLFVTNVPTTIERKPGVGPVWPWKVRVLNARYCPTWAVRYHRRLVEVRREPLSAITDEGARNEGIARLGWEPTRDGFLRGFREFRGLAADADPEVTVYSWAPGEVSDAK